MEKEREKKKKNHLKRPFRSHRFIEPTFKCWVHVLRIDPIAYPSIQQMLFFKKIELYFFSHVLFLFLFWWHFPFRLLPTEASLAKGFYGLFLYSKSATIKSPTHWIDVVLSNSRWGTSPPFFPFPVNHGLAFPCDGFPRTELACDWQYHTKTSARNIITAQVQEPIRSIVTLRRIVDRSRRSPY